MNRKTLSIIVLLIAAAAPAMAADPVGEQVQKNLERFSREAAVVKQKVDEVANSPVATELQTALADLKEAPRSFKRQVAVADAILRQIDAAAGSLDAIKDGSLAENRDKVVNGLRVLAEAQTHQAGANRRRAQNAEGEQRANYERLAATCERFAQAYKLRADQYEALPIAEQMVTLQGQREYLNAAREVTLELRDRLLPIMDSDDALKQLEQLNDSIAAVDRALTTFSEQVLAGALGDDLAENAGGKGRPAS